MIKIRGLEDLDLLMSQIKDLRGILAFEVVGDRDILYKELKARVKLLDIDAVGLDSLGKT